VLVEGYEVPYARNLTPTESEFDHSRILVKHYHTSELEFVYESKLSKFESREERTIQIGVDGRCICSQANCCPLGRTGMAFRCTASELMAAGYEVELKPSPLVKELMKHELPQHVDEINWHPDYQRKEVEHQLKTGKTITVSAEEYEAFLQLKAKAAERAQESQPTRAYVNQDGYKPPPKNGVLADTCNDYDIRGGT
jgi:hypothetical protein